MPRWLLGMAGGLLAVASAARAAAPVTVWTAESPVAMAMTGDLRMAAGRVDMVQHSFVLRNGVVLAGDPLAEARRLAGAAEGATALMLHAREIGDETSRLCSGRPVRWMLFVTKGREMEMVVFAGERRLNLLAAEEREQRTCGVYRYARTGL